MFLGCVFPPLKHNFNHRELIFVETAFQKWDFSFILAYLLGIQITDRVSNGPPNCAIQLSTAEGGCKFEHLASSFMFRLQEKRVV